MNYFSSNTEVVLMVSLFSLARFAMGGSMLDIPPFEEGNPDQVPSEIERLRLEIRSHDSEMQITAAAKAIYKVICCQ